MLDDFLVFEVSLLHTFLSKFIRLKWENVFSIEHECCFQCHSFARCGGEESTVTQRALELGGPF